MTGTPETAPDWIADNEMNDRCRFWTRANVGEVLPEPPSPLGWDLVWETGVLAGWRDCAINRLGTPESELTEHRPEVVGLFGGYGYLGATFVRVWAERTPGMSSDAIDAAYFGDHPDVPVYVPETWHDNAESTAVMEQWIGWVMTTADVPELLEHQADAEAARAGRPDLAAMSVPELLDYARSFTPQVRLLFDWHINMSGAASIGPGALGQICAAIGRPEAAMELIAGLGGVDSAAPSYAMWTISRTVRESPALMALFDGGPNGLNERLRSTDDADAHGLVAALDRFLREFGSRGPNEWDISAPSWEVEPNLVLAAIDRMRLADDDASPMANQSDRSDHRAALIEEISAMLAADAEAQGTFLAAVQSASVFVPGRERTKTNIIKVINESRVAAWEIGRRLVDNGLLEHPKDVCLLFENEIEPALADPDAWSGVVAARQAMKARIESVEPPFIITDEVPPIDTWGPKGGPPQVASVVGDTLQGVPGCPGTARGRARIVLDPSDPTILEPGDILVAPHTDPAWTPLFVPAAGVVVDVGAALSHAIIVSRELGIPCAVSVTGATKKIPDGALIEVDGATGLVTVIEA